MKTSFIRTLLLISSLAFVSSIFAQVSVSYGPTTSLGSTLQSNTAFVDGVYRESTWGHPASFVNSFVAGGLTFTKVKNFSSFTIDQPALAVTLVSVGYTERVPYDLGFKTGNGSSAIYTNVFTDLNNANKPLDTRTAFLTAPTTSTTSVSMYSVYQDVTRVYQNDRAGWAFYNVSGTDTYLAFAEIGVSGGIDFNDSVVLFETAIPEPTTYGLFLGLGTMAIVMYRRRK